MKNYFFCFISFLLLSLSSCQPSVEQGTTAEPEAYQVSTVEVHRHYLRYGETEPFTNEFGKVVRYAKKDTTILEYCKDSTVTFHRPSGEFQTSRSNFCYPQKVPYVQGNYLVNPSIESLGKAFKRSQVKHTFNLDSDGKNYQVSRIFSITSEDAEGKKILLHSNEYWSEDLGLLFKIDENFGIKRRRVIKTVGIKDTAGKVVDINPVFERIYADSVDWITKRDDGTPWF